MKCLEFKNKRNSEKKIIKSAPEEFSLYSQMLIERKPCKVYYRIIFRTIFQIQRDEIIAETLNIGW